MLLSQPRAIKASLASPSTRAGDPLPAIFLWTLRPPAPAAEALLPPLPVCASDAAAAEAAPRFERRRRSCCFPGGMAGPPVEPLRAGRGWRPAPAVLRLSRATYSTRAWHHSRRAQTRVSPHFAGVMGYIMCVYISLYVCISIVSHRTIFNHTWWTYQSPPQHLITLTRNVRIVSKRKICTVT